MFTVITKHMHSLSDGPIIVMDNIVSVYNCPFTLIVDYCLYMTIKSNQCYNCQCIQQTINYKDRYV